MKIVVLGAGGRTGQRIVSVALARGAQVTALTGHAERLAGTGARVVAGSPYTGDGLTEALAGCDAVASALNVSRRTDNPFSRLTAPPDLISRSIENTVAGMSAAGVRRIVVISSVGVGDSRPRMPAPIRALMALSNIRHAMRDHERQERLLAGADLDWTVVRPSLLHDGPGGEIIVATRPEEPLGGRISRQDVARFVVEVILSASHVGESPCVGGA